MARIRMVTRAFTGSKATVLAMNVETAEPETLVFELPIRFSKEEKCLTYLRDKFDTDTIKIVHIESYEETKTLRGMDEAEFIKLSVVLDPETRRPLTTEEVKPQ